MKKLAVARFWFQGNAFSPAPTTLESFEGLIWQKGIEALNTSADGETELAAVNDFIATNHDWDVSVLRCAAAMPGGPIEEAMFGRIVSEICTELGQDRWDAVYICLHGAAITSERTSPDIDLLRAVRRVIGDTPLAASFALHANLHPEIAELLDFATVSRTNYASDLRDTAARLLKTLARIASGDPAPHCTIVSTGMVLSSFNMRTDSEPMRGLMLAARDAEGDGVLDASLCGGFPYADSPQCAAKVMVWAKEESAARHAAIALAHAWQERKNDFRVTLPGPNVALAQALLAPPGLVAITDSADNPGSGGAADSTTLFRALLEFKHPQPVVFAFFADAPLVQRARQAGTGASIDAEFGARTSRDFGAMVKAPARVLRLTDGQYKNRGQLDFGAQVCLGATAVLEVGGVQVIVASDRKPADDPAFFELHGINLSATRLLCVKAKNRFRAAFSPLCVQIIDCDAPGPATVDLRALPFQNVKMR